MWITSENPQLQHVFNCIFILVTVEVGKSMKMDVEKLRISHDDYASADKVWPNHPELYYDKPLQKKYQQFTYAQVTGPDFVCTCCHKTFFPTGVKKFNDNYSKSVKKFISSRILSYNGVEYICSGCHKSLLEKMIPHSAVANGLTLDVQPEFMRNLNDVEVYLVAGRIFFMKIVQLFPAGKS